MRNEDYFHYDLMDDDEYRHQQYINNIKQELDENMKEFITLYDPYKTIKPSEGMMDELSGTLGLTYDIHNIWTVLKRNGYYYYFPDFYYEDNVNKTANLYQFKGYIVTKSKHTKNSKIYVI
jgi:hypothetical protein